MWVWDAFWRLSFSRQFTINGPGPILVSEIVAYAELMQINDAGSRDMLLKGIQTMDRLWLENQYKKDPEQEEE